MKTEVKTEQEEAFEKAYNKLAPAQQKAADAQIRKCAAAAARAAKTKDAADKAMEAQWEEYRKLQKLLKLPSRHCFVE
jgi:hypothetical protein